MKCVFGLVVSLLFSMQLSAAPADEEAEAASLMNEYRDSVATLDASRVSRYFNEPFVFVTAAKTTAFSVHSDVEAWLRPQYLQLQSRGYARSEWAPMRVKALGSGVVLASARFVRYKVDGSELDVAGSTYMLRKTSDGWRIAVQTPHSASAALPLQ